MQRTYPRILYPEGFDERAEGEMGWRGYLSHIRVQLDDERTVAIHVIEPVRLQQDLDALVESGTPCFAEVGLIVVPEVTRAAIEAAVHHLFDRGFFEFFRPLAPGDRPWDV